MIANENSNSTYFFEKNKWKFGRLSFIIYWLIVFLTSIIKSNQIPFPVGICSLINFEWLLLPTIKSFFIILSLLLCLLYLLEYKMAWVCFLLFMISTISFTIEESNGLYYRNTLLSVIFFVQFISYSTSSKEKNKWINSMQYSIQVILGAYTLSAISKLKTAGFYWVINGKRITLQILKSHFQEFSDFGNQFYLVKGNLLVNYIEHHPMIIYSILTISLLLELFSLVALFNSKMTFYYGILLLFMHVGIYLIMDIAILPIIVPMVIFMINPLFISWYISNIKIIPIFNKLYNKM